MQQLQQQEQYCFLQQQYLQVNQQVHQIMETLTVKQRGGVTWTARTHLPPAEQLPGLISTFAVHEGWGDKEDWGIYSIDRPADGSFDGGSLTMDVTCVNIIEDEAWFAGTVSSATGGYEGTEGNAYLYWVNDLGTPGSDGDLIGGRGYATINQACGVVDSMGWQGTGVVTDGNLVVHLTGVEVCHVTDSFNIPNPWTTVVGQWKEVGTSNLSEHLGHGDFLWTEENEVSNDIDYGPVIFGLTWKQVAENNGLDTTDAECAGFVLDF